MKTYNIYGSVTGSKYLGQIKAENEEEAKQLAWEGKKVSLGVSFCHQCSGECENAEIDDIHVEEEEGKK